MHWIFLNIYKCQEYSSKPFQNYSYNLITQTQKIICEFEMSYGYIKNVYFAHLIVFLDNVF